jgi:Domain of unknown function (DUF5916)/Carbohydrate family 9 binding domain-like
MRQRVWLAGATLLGLMLVPRPVAAQGAEKPSPTLPPPRTFTTSRVTTSITIDGVLDEDAWRLAGVVPLVWEWAPGDNVPPPVKTDCLVTYDDDNLYIAFRASDPDSRLIRAHLMDRDEIDTLIQDDHIGVLIDTFNDERRAFQFRVNPLGVQADAILSEQDGIEDFSWDMIWSSAGRITADGYIVEMALPLKQLRFPGGGGPQTWGFEAFRSWPRNVRHRLSSQPRDRNKVCLLCQESKLAGFEGLRPGRNIELDPTATFSRTDTRTPGSAGPLPSGDLDPEAGLSARWSITPNMTVNGAVNPDFSQVEADVAQLDVNTRFALFYPEKRPFFLEGVDFFSTPIRAVFTRTIVDPVFGGKLTGKQGGNAVGVFVARDTLNNLVLPANESSESTSLDAGVTTTVARYRRDVGRGSTVGALATSREGSGYHNRQAGADVFWQPSAADAVRVQFLGSDTLYPREVSDQYAQPQDAFAGSAFYADYLHFSRSWIWTGLFESYSPGFRSDTGFVPRVDYRNVLGQFQRRWWRGAGSWFNTIDLGVRGWHSTDADWHLSEETVAGFIDYTGPYQMQFELNLPRDVVVYQGVRYEYPRPNVVFGIKPNGDLNLRLIGRFGGGVDYDNGRPATDVLQLGPAIEYRPWPRVSLTLSHNLDRLAVEGGRLYLANLTQLRAVYYLNVRTFVRAILQYTDISRDPTLYTFEVEPRSRRLFGQYLFSYKFNPQTVLFLGYSDTSTNAVTPTNNTATTGLERQNRTFFVKVGYAWIL